MAQPRKKDQPKRALNFADAPDPETLAELQGVSPITDFDELLGDFWPEDENVEEFITNLRAWRRESGTKGKGKKLRESRKAG